MQVTLNLAEEQEKLCSYLSEELSEYLEPTEYTGKTVHEFRGHERSHFTIKKTTVREQVLEATGQFFSDRECTIVTGALRVKVFKEGRHVATARIHHHGYGALSVFVEVH